MLIRRKSAISGTHDWKDIDVVASLRPPITTVSNLRWCSSPYTPEMLSPIKRRVATFTRLLSTGRKLETWIFDRSGCYSPGSFDIHDDPERSIRASDSLPMRKSEAELLALANQRGVEGVPRLVAHHDIANVNDIRSSMTSWKPYSLGDATANIVTDAGSSLPLSQSQGPASTSVSEVVPLIGPTSASYLSIRVRNLSKRYKSNQPSGLRNQAMRSMEVTQSKPTSRPSYVNRVLCCLVTYPAGRPIYNYRSLVERLQALRDAIKAHHSLYKKGEILHRDISENNVLITDHLNPGFSGMLIDLSRAKELGSESSNARCRTGTMEFMAIEVILEPASSRLTEWYTGSPIQIEASKALRVRDMFERPLEESPVEFDRLEPLFRELRRLRRRKIQTLYGPVIKALEETIAKIK
ncbi:hypothetical protein GGR50DRAFT_696997 [Xylaria sp. CBS 124048]|nr:hypothetical protein GGR50DRAFT_696997 [Xylaria sp. CBS 124048]